MFLTAPLLNNRAIPQQAKVGLAFAITLILFPFHSAHFVVPTDLIQFAVVGAQELMIGLILGFVADLVFISLQFAGEFVSIQMGLSMTTVLDPDAGIQVPVIGQIFFYFGIFLFLGLNIHHALILGLNHSFDVLPLGQFFKSSGMMCERFLYLTGQMFSMALLVAAPVMGILFVSEIALAFVAKVMPQMNIFMVGMPLKLIMGLVTIAVCLPYISEFMQGQFQQLYAHLKMLFN